MIPKECKRLAEVDFPIAEVSKHAAREKAGPSGHPSRLHLWWARRPLASSRAVLMALLLPDPCDEQCPKEFKQQAREILGEVRQPPKTDEDLQKGLLWFIGSFANWHMSSNAVYLKVARNLMRAAHPEEAPLLVDPFAGGGSIPLEAIRIGCETFASDLNPVACLIMRVMLEDIPRCGPDLSAEVRRVGGEIKAAVEKGLVDLYPADPDGATPIAYLWARTVRCDSPNCGAEIPLMRSLWLSKKAHRKRALRTRVVRPEGEAPRLEFEIFIPSSDKEVRGGTVTLAKATCLCCGLVLSPDRVRTQLGVQKGGADARFDNAGTRIGGALMIAVVTIKSGEQGRHYRLPSGADYEAVRKAQMQLAQILASWEGGGREGHCPVPVESTPQDGTGSVGGGFRTRKYGITSFGDLFSARQKRVLISWLDALSEHVGRDSGSELVDASSLVFGRVAMSGTALTKWNAVAEKMQHFYGMQAVPMAWDFAEVVSTVDAPGAWSNSVDLVAKVVEAWPPSVTGQVQLADAAEHPLPDQSAGVWFTDPPYYDAVPYADLSDFFLVWLKRTLPDDPLLKDPFDAENVLSPKVREAVRDEQEHLDGRPKKSTKWYEDRMHRAFAEGRRILREDGIGSVVFAHKTTEGWEALLSGLIRGGWTITASWPIATEMGTRLRARDSAALATSVHLVCRPRPEDAPVGDWAEVLRDLPVRVAAWIERLQGEGVRGADLVFACIGPALEIFSRYSKVETAEGREVGLPEYLEKVWEVVGRAALERVLGDGDATTGALEEDARLTALFLWTMQSTEAPDDNDKKEEEDDDAIAKVAAKGFSLPYDVVRRFAQPMGIDLDVWTGRTLGQDKGVVRLLPVAERAKQLFGDDGARAAAEWIERDPTGNVQGALFPELEEAPQKKGRGRGKKAIIGANAEIQTPDATTLDRVHAAMLLQQGGQANALRTLLKAEQDRGPEFLRLANALSALYPKGAEEKRLLDAMLLAVPR